MINFKLKFIFTVILFIVNNSYSQVNMEWERLYNGNYTHGNRLDGASGVAVDVSGNIYVTGYSLMDVGQFNYVTVKYNSAGVQQWIAVYSGPGQNEDAPSGIALDSSGNIYVTGYSFQPGSGNDFATIKYNPAGIQQWAQTYNGIGNGSDQAFSIKVDGPGNIYVTGVTTGSGGDYDYTTIKYNTNGVQQWVQNYNGTGNGDDVPASIAIDASGNSYVTGYSTGNGTGHDFTTIKYNTSGVQQWVMRYNGDGNSLDEALSIAVDNLGNSYVSGPSTGNGTGIDYATIKYNSLGVQQWVQRYNSSGNISDHPCAVGVDGFGNCYVTGDRYTTIKYNTNGVQQWIQSYGAVTATSMTVDNIGNCYVTGSDYQTIKFSSSGAIQWVQTFPYGTAWGIVTDVLGNVYVTGTKWVTSTNPDYCTIKYSQPLGIHPISSEIPKTYSLSQNFPNPFNPSTKIEFQIAHFGFVSLKVYDILGTEVSSFVNESLQPGNYAVTWDASKYSSGIYYYKISGMDFSETKKMILIK